jgi:hypothetical protein
VATPPHAPDRTEPRTTTALDYELPQYRAINRWAIFSLVFGLLAPLTFANFNFLIAAGLAILCGIMALRAIKRFPDLFTGKNLANIGIVLGLVFSLSPISMHFASLMVTQREAEAFGRKFADVLKTKDLGDALWHRIPPAERRGVTPAEIVERFRQQEAEQQEGNPARASISIPFRALFDLMTDQGESLRFVKVEKCGQFDLTPYALVVLKLDLPQQALDAYEREHPDWRSSEPSFDPLNRDPDHLLAHDHSHDHDHDHAAGDADHDHDHAAESQAAAAPSKPASDTAQPSARAKASPRSPAMETILRKPDMKDNLFIALDLRAEVQNGQKKWYINEFVFPYQMNTYDAKSLRKGTQHGDHVH